MTNTDVAVMISAIIVLVLWIGIFKIDEKGSSGSGESREIKKNKDDLERDRISRQQ